MYNIGICDDGKGICASLEEMVQQYAKEIFLFHFIGKAYLACKVFKSSRLRLGVHVGLPNVVL